MRFSFPNKNLGISILIAFLLILGFIFIVIKPAGVRELYSAAEKFVYSRMIPPSKKVVIKTETQNFKVDPELSQFGQNIVNELGVFNENKINTHDKRIVSYHTIRELHVVFDDQAHFWPGLMTKNSGAISNFDIAVDDRGIATLRIWINPAETVDQNRLSTYVNRTFFLALFIVTNWDTYQDPNSGYYDYLGRIDDEIYNTSIEERPLKVIN